MLRIIHTGDIHLGDLTGPTKDGQNLRRIDTLNCMRAVVEAAQTESPDITIIAGDLFNRSRVWADTALEDVNDAIEVFLKPLCECSDIVALLFGTENHDNPKAFEVLEKSTRDLKNLRIYTRPCVDVVHTKRGPAQIMAVPGFDKGRLRLFCPGADKETENRNATALINDVVLGLSTQIDRDRPAILVAHYTVAGALADNGSTFLAGQDVVITPATIDAAGVDLACFGHIHHPQKLASNTPAYYCGSVNQLNFNDEGTEHGFYIHDLHKDPFSCVSSGFIRTPEREHYTYRMSQEDVATFVQTGELTAPTEPVKDKIVRVRYICNAETEKAFNRAELQKRLQSAAGAFYVAEVLPEEIEALDAKSELTEHDGPHETLARWLDLNEVPAETRARLVELAEPIIKQADDGRDADKHTGAFVPMTIQVKNYRSYTEASFDFEPVHMAMVNGQNGVGKSSLFMDAIADCLYEQTRNEDIGGWVRDGTKSGSITFTFGMGGQKYRVVRTRTKSGKGTLALHRFNTETESWEDESDTTMRLTQAKIERLLGMDCNTFCSIALIRQDAYGLFLEASSDRRMEVLSALLGLDIYTRMEDLARTGATDQRRKIAALKERISIMLEQAKEKDGLLTEDAEITERMAEARNALEAAEKVIAAAEQADALRRQVLEQAEEKEAQANDFELDRLRKLAQIQELEKRRDTSADLAKLVPQAKAAADTLADLRAQLEELAPKLEQARSLRQELGNAEIAMRDALRRLLSLREGKGTAEKIVAQKAEIEAAVAEMEKLSGIKAELREKVRRQAELLQALSTADHQAREYLTESKSVIASMTRELQAARDAAEKLKDSGCTAERPTCVFLSSATEEAARIPELEAALDAEKEQRRQQYEVLKKARDDAAAEYQAVGDPKVELDELEAYEREVKSVADGKAMLAAAEAKIEEIDKAIAEADAAHEAAEGRRGEIAMQLAPLEDAEKDAEAMKAVIRSKQPMADMLGKCSAAEATVFAVTSQIEEAHKEVEALTQRRDAAMADADRIKETAPATDTDLPGLRAVRDLHRKTITDLTTRRGELKAKLSAIAEAEEKATELRRDVEATAIVLNDYTTLVQAFGLEGIQYMIIRGVVPEIMHQSNDILASMTGGRMAVDIRTEKEQKSTKQIVNSLEVWISSIQGTNRPYLSHSGGEKVKIALAVTLGLADVKARRAGVQLGMLFIDEPPFLDADGTEAYADALTNMAARNPAMRILAISHDPTMKARFSQNIVVTAGEDGSTVTME